MKNKSAKTMLLLVIGSATILTGCTFPSFGKKQEPVATELPQETTAVQVLPTVSSEDTGIYFKKDSTGQKKSLVSAEGETYTEYHIDEQDNIYNDEGILVMTGDNLLEYKQMSSVKFESNKNETVDLESTYDASAMKIKTGTAKKSYVVYAAPRDATCNKIKVSVSDTSIAYVEKKGVQAKEYEVTEDGQITANVVFIAEGTVDIIAQSGGAEKVSDTKHVTVQITAPESQFSEDTPEVDINTDVSSAPAIVTQPSSRSITTGGTATFYAKATGADSAKWYFISADGATSFDATGLNSMYPAVTVSGATSEQLTLQNIPLTLNGWKVQCKFSNYYGAVLSTQATLTVANATGAGYSAGSTGITVTGSGVSDPTATPIPTTGEVPTATGNTIDATSTTSYHMHSYAVDSVVSPTESAGGYTVYKCSCGDSYKADYTDPVHVHSYVDTIVEPTATAYGYTEHTCACGYSYSDNYTNPTRTGPMYNSTAVEEAGDAKVYQYCACEPGQNCTLGGTISEADVTNNGGEEYLKSLMTGLVDSVYSIMINTKGAEEIVLDCMMKCYCSYDVATNSYTYCIYWS